MQLSLSLHNLLHRFGIDINHWPRQHDDVMDWWLGAVIIRREINCVIDIGANHGQFGQLIRSLGYKGRIVSFEPSPRAIPQLTATTVRDKEWRVHPVALSSEAGTAELNLHEVDQMDSLLPALSEAAAQYDGLRGAGTATVTLSTLDIEIPQAIEGISEPRVLLKSDTQGHDLEVLKGAKGGLPREIVGVLVELSAQAEYQGQPRLTRVMDHLMDDGFMPVAFAPIATSSDGMRMIDLDGLFMRGATEGPDFGSREDWRSRFADVPADVKGFSAL